MSGEDGFVVLRAIGRSDSYAVAELVILGDPR